MQTYRLEIEKCLFKSPTIQVLFLTIQLHFETIEFRNEVVWFRFEPIEFQNEVGWFRNEDVCLAI